MESLYTFALGYLAVARSPRDVLDGFANASARWVSTWATSPQPIEPGDAPPEPGLGNNTLRQFVYVSLGGGQVRVRISNEFGKGPATLRGAHLARVASSPAIDVGTDVALTFDGSKSVTIPAGGVVCSDPIGFSLPEQNSVAITIHFGNVPDSITGHPGSRTTSYIAQGDALDSEIFQKPTATDHWYYISGIDVLAPASCRVVVTLGDSLTDGRGSTSNGNDRWPDVLSRRLRGNSATSGVAVVNAGIGGNALVFGGLGPTARERFERDVLGQAGVRWVIVLEGVNDIGNAPNASVGDRLIAVYQEFIDKAHAADVLVYGVPILPFAGSQYDTPLCERIRQRVNDWIRTSGKFDAVLDLDAAVVHPDDPFHLDKEHDSGDHLHLSARGYRAIANAIDLSLFEE